MPCHRGKILNIVTEPSGLVHRLSERLAHFFGIGAGEELSVLSDQTGQFHQVVGPLDRRQLAPGFLRLISGIYSGLYIRFRRLGDLRDHFFRGGVDHVEHFPVAIRNKFTVDKQFIRLHLLSSFTE